MRRRRAWWGRRPWRERKYPNARALHAFEDEVILRKVRELGTPRQGVWIFSASSLVNANPDLFSPPRLRVALKRMRRERKIGGGGRLWSARNPMYELNELPKAKAA